MLPAAVHRHIYLVLIALLGGCMVTSTWASNLVWVLLGVNWLFEGWSQPERWRTRWHMVRSSRLLQAFLLLYAIYLVGMLWTSDVSQGLDVLRGMLPMLIVPLVTLTSAPVTGRARQMILTAYTGTVLVVSIISTVRLFTIPDLPYRDAVPYISHIRFALNCCMVIYLCIMAFLKLQNWLARTGMLLLAAWMLVFLILLHSYTALAVLLVAAPLTMLVYYRRWPLLAAWLILMLGAGTVVLVEVKSYYRMVPQATEPLQAFTAGGRPYTHRQDGIIENGNYLNNYLCPDELRAEWPRRSDIPYDTVWADGWDLQSVLVRYLNATGLPKDSAGLWSLNDEQLRQIESGIENPVYASHNPVRKMVYVMLFEREFYLHTHAVSGFTMLQRFELWKAAAHVTANHRWTGVGTGDVRNELHAELRAMDSPLADTHKLSHNQYLWLLAAFGVLGFALVAVAFGRSFARWCLAPKRAGRIAPVLFAWTLTIFISCLTEDTLCTLAGILFCTFFLPFCPATDPDSSGQR